MKIIIKVMKKKIEHVYVEEMDIYAIFNPPKGIIYKIQIQSPIILSLIFPES